MQPTEKILVTGALALCTLIASDAARAQAALEAFFEQRMAAAGNDIAKRCEALNHAVLERVADAPARVISAKLELARKTTPQDKTMFVKRGHSMGAPMPPLEAYPAHCRVDGYIAPQIRFVMMLPAEREKWNERFMLAACDGFCGKAHDQAPVPGLHRGFASITNNGGHDSRAPFDAVWAYNNREGEIDFAYRANHLTAQVGKAIAKAYYGVAPRYSYLAGFSKGGNAGLFSAQRYPDDFDGIFSKAPVVEYQAKNNVHFPWIARAAYPDGKTPVMDSTKVELVHRGVMAACDAKDGLRDGIIDDPRRCSFDPAVLRCKSGQDPNQCLDDAQVQAVRKLYARPTDAAGNVIYPAGQNPGSEGDWGRFIFPEPDADNIGYALWGGAGSLKYLAFEQDPGPAYDWTTFDVTRERSKLDFMSKILDPDSPDLKAFKASGGKMIIVHGWADGAISAQVTIDWFEKMREFMGGRAATDEFVQLYVVPGIKHGSGGSAPYEYDALTPLMKWVEEGVAPTQLSMIDDPYIKEGTPEFVTVRRTRPAFPWPARARWDGKGDPNVAASFKRVEN